jgi:hypothetical protein
VLGIRIKESPRVAPELLVYESDVRGTVIFANNYTISGTDLGDDVFYGSYQFVTGNGGVKQMVVVGTDRGKTMCDAVINAVWSGANLTSPIRKEEEDILRVIYSYELSNVASSFCRCSAE